MVPFVKELKKVEKGKEINLYFKEIILEYMKKNNFQKCHISSMQELLNEDDAKVLEDFYTIEEPESSSSRKKLIKIGILKDGEYSKNELGYIYNEKEYDLLGDITGMFVVKNEKLSRDIPDTTFVCEGATLKCTSRGSITSLQVMDARRETLNGARIATEADNTLAEIDFKKCGKSSCSFSSGSGWQEVSIGAMSNDHMQLLNTSYIMCDKGSKIIIENPNCVEKGN